jgi:uncharacterized protein with HEPN domain
LVLQERLSHEFVRHYLRLIKLTEGDPSRLAGAVERDPELAVALTRLGEIIAVIDRERNTARYRELAAHSQFAKARSDFEERWASGFGEYRDRVYLPALSQMAEAFLPGYRLLRDRTDNDPSAVERARGMYSELDHVMVELWQIYDTLHDRRRGFSRFIGQAPSEFREAVADFEQRWADVLFDVRVALLVDGLLEGRPRTQHAAGALDHKWLDDLLGSLPLRTQEPPDKSRFDPYRESIADLIKELESYCRDDEGKGLKWLQDTAGLDFSALQERWKEVSDWTYVPDHVAEKYKRAVPRGLFGYLDQIRLAYIIGADLPALALCRSTTELVIRRHYASDVADPHDGKKNRLIPLMKKVQPRLRALSHLFKYIDIANDVLHSRMLDENVHDLPGRYRVLVCDWVRLLRQLIDDIPEPLAGASQTPPSPIPRLTQMIEAIERIRSETAGVSLEAFEADWRKRWLVERGVEIISEASRHLSEQLKARHPTIPWPKIAGIGDVLRYGYERVAPDVIWGVARDYLGPLETACRAELAAAANG